MIDKSTTQQILGCLIKKPQILSQVDKYSLSINDFSSRFEKYIFYAISGLYSDGASTISVVDISNYLESNESAKQTFSNNNGVEYIADIIEFSNIDNFDFYYNKLKKINLLNDLKKQGIDINDFYIEDLTDSRANEVNNKFEELTTKNIIDSVKKKLLKLENVYSQTDEVQTENVADGIDELIESFENEPEVGKPVQGEIYNQVIDGAQKGCLTIRSGASGTGKTRNAVADACYLAFPMRYEWTTGKWEDIGENEKVLFIVTEQTFRQVKKMILAYLTGINESKFKYGKFSENEWKVINQAKQILKDFSENMILIKIPNPTIELVKTMVRENVLTHNIGYVFYDYIFIGTALLDEFRGFTLRNDEILLMFATALKDLAVELDVCMMTSTQVNANVDDNRNIRNESSLAGGRATINKADNGAIMARPTTEELTALEPLTSKFGIPNIVTDIFKVRSGQWSQVRIWSYVDLGVMRKKDLFITDARLEAVEGFFLQIDYRLKDWTDETVDHINKYIKDLNKAEEDDVPWTI